MKKLKEVKPGIYEIDARVHIDDVNEQFELNIPEHDDYETIGGFVFTQLGKIPDPQETFTWKNLKFTILDADKRRVLKLQVERDASIVVGE